MEKVHLHAAGIDIGSQEHWVAVPEGRDESCVRKFSSLTHDLHRLADWLEACGIETVAMESTGVYWIPLYEILEERGFEVLLVNARHVKNVPGRKTDVLDCQWLQQLHSFGLLRGSFRPQAEIAALRSYLRHRDRLVESTSACIQRMQKALMLMNLQLHHVLSDLTGLTGLRILRDIVAGRTDPEQLALHRDPHVRASQQEIAESLRGHYRDEHVFELRQTLEAYDFFQQQIHAY
ncbi:MAG TPA: IS110 family transposase, partial [Candidatus Krumholzibacteria bacterium]